MFPPTDLPSLIDYTTPTKSSRTCSTVSSIMYRVTITLSFWLMRIARAMACLSTLGFHWSSTIKMRFAAVRLSLLKPVVRIQDSVFSYEKGIYTRMLLFL